MKQEEEKNQEAPKQESVKDLKKAATQDDAVKKGYNEKNPAQPQGAFKPDAATPDN